MERTKIMACMLALAAGEMASTAVTAQAAENTTKTVTVPATPAETQGEKPADNSAPADEASIVAEKNEQADAEGAARHGAQNTHKN